MHITRDGSHCQFSHELSAGEMKTLLALDDAHVAQDGLYMSYSELSDSLESMKNADQIRDRKRSTRKNSILFKYLRAN